MNLKGKWTITVVMGIVCFVLIAVMFMQFKTVNQTDITSIEIMRESELRTELASWKSKYEDVQEKVNENNERIEEYKQGTEDNVKATQLLEEELNQAKTSLGLTDVRGEGVVVTLEDNDIPPDYYGEDDVYDGKINVYDILQLINELKLAGAEAISINDVRVVDKTDIALVMDTYIVVDGVRISSPYTVKAIGNQTALESGLMQKDSGYMDKIINAEDKKATVQRENEIEIYKYDKEWETKYIQEN